MSTEHTSNLESNMVGGEGKDLSGMPQLDTADQCYAPIAEITESAAASTEGIYRVDSPTATQSVRAQDVGTGRRRLASTALAFALVAASAATTTESAVADSTLCSGYSSCDSTGYTDHGYGAASGSSYWGAYPGHNCTNYVAYVETKNGVARPSFSLGDAKDWWAEASGHVPESPTTPVVGSVAWWGANQGGVGADGHVAYVEAVNSNSITISEDAYPSGPYDWMTISDGSSRWPGGFIYFDNLTPPPPPAFMKADLVVHNTDNTWAVATSTGASFNGQGIGLTNWGKGDWVGVGDVTGDGRADIVVHNPSNNSFSVAVNDGSGNFDAPGTGTWLSNWGAGDWVGLGDVNGDGKDDLVVYNPSNNSFAVALSTGSSFAGSGNWLTGWGIGDFVGLADVNGDGKADIVVHNPSNEEYDVALSTGSSFVSNGAWLSDWSAGDWAGLGDVNGDGKADLVIHNTDNTWAVATSTGSSFSGTGDWLTGWGKGDSTELADVTGDGKADIIVHNPGNNTFSVAASTGSNFNGPATGVWLNSWGDGDWVGSANLNGN